MKQLKLFIKSLLLALSIFVFMSCSDFLDKENPNTVTDNNYWKTEADAFAAIATVYSPIRGQMYGPYGAFTGYQTQNVRGDDVWAIPNDDTNMWDLTIFQNTPSTDRYDYDRLYRSIHRANTFLYNIDRVEMDEGRKQEMIGEVHFLRAFNYFLLATMYGDVPIRTIPADVSSEETMKPSSPEAEVWKQIESDLLLAKEKLPVSRDASQNGRVVKGTAIAYLGKTYLYLQRYEEAKKELGLIMTASYTYDLVSNFEDNYTITGEFNKESIFELNYAQYGNGTWGDEGSTSTMGMVLPTFIGPPATGGWFKLMPSAFVVEEFIAEQRPQGSDTRFDKRMYTTFYFKYSDFNDPKPDDKWYGTIDASGKDTRMDMDALWNSTAAKRAQGGANYPEPVFPTIDGVKGRFLWKKYTNFWSEKEKANDMYDPVPMDNNLRVMRFAEVLLMHAEAAARTGDLAGASADLKRIRDRAGLAAKTWGSADELMKEIEHQRLLELFGDGQRFFDLKRWYNTDQMKAILVKNKKTGANNFQEKHRIFPIPQPEVTSNTAIEQNPLWK